MGSAKGFFRVNSLSDGEIKNGSPSPQESESKQSSIAVWPYEVRKLLDDYYQAKTISCTHPKSTTIARIEKLYITLDAKKPLTTSQLHNLADILRTINSDGESSPKTFTASDDLNKRIGMLANYVLGDRKTFGMMVHHPDLHDYVTTIKTKLNLSSYNNEHLNLLIQKNHEALKDLAGKENLKLSDLDPANWNHQNSSQVKITGSSSYRR